MSKTTPTLIEKLKELGVNPTKISKDTGIPRDRIYQWLNGRGTPKYNDMQTLEAYIGTFTNVEPVSSPPPGDSSPFTVKQIVGMIQSIKDWTIERVAESVGYSRVRLGQAMNTNDADMRGLLLKQHGHLIANVPQQNTEAHNDALIVSLREQIQLLKAQAARDHSYIQRLEKQNDLSLDSMAQTQLVLLAYQKAAHNLRVQFAAGADPKKRKQLQAHADKVLAESFLVRQETGTVTNS